jgi:hypothetical protein
MHVFISTWFSPGTPASSTTKTGRHEIAEILLKVALNTKNQIQSIKSIQYSTSTEAPFGQLIKQKVSKKLLYIIWRQKKLNILRH